VAGAVLFELACPHTRQHSKHLAGYSQQDAHEFLIALLDGLHTYCGGVSGLLHTHLAYPKLIITDSRTCGCVIHRVFTGMLQSDVTCTKCQFVSTTVDPFWDISLDINPFPSFALTVVLTHLHFAVMETRLWFRRHKAHSRHRCWFLFLFIIHASRVQEAEPCASLAECLLAYTKVCLHNLHFVWMRAAARTLGV
jgi:hypothetical protein